MESPPPTILVNTKVKIFGQIAPIMPPVFQGFLSQKHTIMDSTFLGISASVIGVIWGDIHFFVCLGVTKTVGNYGIKSTKNQRITSKFELNIDQMIENYSWILLSYWQRSQEPQKTP